MHLSAALLTALAAFAGLTSLAHAQPIELAYGADAAEKLDLSLPAKKGFATVVFVHGGSLDSGDKADADYGRVCDPFPAAGLACANVNYRLAPQAWPAQAEDVAAAVAWVRANIGVRGGNPARIFLLGHSSGATLVALIASDEHYLGRRGMKLSDLRGVMPMGSIMWDDELEQVVEARGRDYVANNFLRDPSNRIYSSFEAYDDHWPVRHIHPGLPPFLFLIAESEQEQPPVLKTDRRFVEEARKLGNEADYKILAGRKHYTAIRRLQEPGDAVFAIILEFVHQHSQ